LFQVFFFFFGCLFSLEKNLESVYSNRLKGFTALTQHNVMMTSQSVVIFPDAFLILQLLFIEGPEIFREMEVKSYLLLGE
jgi:hypothetical protein